jgi:HAD superfamily hydrolase (TIGR01458 family)
VVEPRIGAAGVKAVLIDIDGVLTVSWEPVEGAVRALQRLRDAQLPVRLLTNTTSRPRSAIVKALAEAGFQVAPEEVLTAVAVTRAYLDRHHHGERIAFLSSGDVREDLKGLRIVPLDGNPEVVVLGGAGPEFNYDTLNQVYARLVDDAHLIAMHRNTSWRTEAGLQLDSGAFLLGLEHAAGVTATVLGKPSDHFFATALHDLGVGPREALMVGDDVEADVLGAQAAGIRGVLVRTGKFTRRSLAAAEGTPDHVVESFADVPGLLGV